MLRIAVVDDEPIILKKIVGRNSVEQSDIDCGKVTNCYNTGSVNGMPSINNDS